MNEELKMLTVVKNKYSSSMRHHIQDEEIMVILIENKMLILSLYCKTNPISK